MKAGAIIIATLACLCLPNLAQAQGMGAFYWGDSDGNGDIGTPDVTSLTAILNNPAASDTVYYTKYPVSRYRQDTDGNGDIGAPDATILRAWLYGDFSTISGGAAQLLLEATTTHVSDGSSVLIGAHALSGTAGALRTGWGVIFAIDSSSDCQTAEIYGYTIQGGDTTAGYGWYHQAYKYTPQPFAPDFGKAWVKVRPTGCTVGQIIKIKVYIPSDTQAVIPGQRFPAELDAPQLVEITANPPPDTIITSHPNNPSNSTTASFSFICDEPPCTFECNLDSAGWSTCSSPQTYDSDTWTATSTTGAPSARYLHRAVWTGAEMIVWGGVDNAWLVLNTGGRYDPATDSWTATSITNAPSARQNYTAVWTGNEMIIWGGYNGSSYYNTGGRYNPATDSWIATTITNAPSAREYHTAVWTGAEMIVWGGYNGSSYFNAGGRYSPATDSWNPTSTTSVPAARAYHTAVWTGSYMIVWGGINGSSYFNTGSRYNPAANSWSATSTTNAPAGRAFDTAIWTGNEMIVWGGYNNSTYFDTGGRYNPATNSWIATSITNRPAGRQSHAAVWAGNEMIVWGGYFYDSSLHFYNTGGRYNPATNSWIQTSTINAPAVRACHSAVWTGAEMIVWGGWDNSSMLDTGGRYRPALYDGPHSFAVRAYDAALNVDPTPATFDWIIDTTPPITSLTSVPTNPSSSSDADFEFNCSETGCTFECNLDNAGWTACSSPWVYLSLPSGDHTFSVRATDEAGNLELNPVVYAWTISINPPDTFITSQPSNPSNSNSASFGFDCSSGPCTFECKLDSGSWTSCSSPANYSGLSNASHTFQVRASDLNNNRDLSPASYTWTIDTIAPDTTITSNPRSHTNITDASFSFTCNDTGCTFKCRIDSGSWNDCTSPQNYSGLAQGNHTFDVYATDWAGNPDPTPASYSWNIDLTIPDTTITSHPPDPSNSANPSFSFVCDEPPCTFECKLDAAGWSTCSSPQTYGNDAWTATSTIGAPSGRSYATAVWTGTEMIVWGGYPLNSGNGKYAPATDSWTATSTTNAPAVRYYHTVVWTGTEMIVWAGAPAVQNTGGRYNPATNSWVLTSTTNAPEARYNHTAIWTGAEMIVWGGLGNPGHLNSGGRYNPVTDSWGATSTTNAPSVRESHTAVWTGSEMIVWGGGDGFYSLNTGGRYNPTSDSWTATSITNAPPGRSAHTTVWTGNEMIIWGGYAGIYLNTGGRYNPGTDSWIATSMTNAPTVRDDHTAVWTGTEMIIWGGYTGSSGLRTGGRYNPATNSWIATSITNAPSARDSHTAIWTGAEMVIWGGDSGGSIELNTGGRYRPTLYDGPHSFAVRAYDAALNVDPTPATYSWTIDTVPPITSLTSVPPNPSSSPDADFEFNCNETSCTFECNLDGAGWTACSSPAVYLSLPSGDHTFSVRATDAAGNLELNPLVYAWTISINPPDTFITSHPPDPSNSSSASFGFDCSAGPCTFECKMDAGSWISCSSPAAYSSLGNGSHTFLVRASDLDNNRDLTPASYTWTIDTIPPDTTITSSPPSNSSSTDAGFSFTCAETGCTFKCRIDSGSWTDCASPWNYAGLAEGSHVFDVYAIDWAGNPDPTPASFSWIIDLTPPDTIITDHPPDPSHSGNASFSFICTEPPCTFECNLDSTGWTACTSPQNYGGDIWIETSTVGAPSARWNHTSVWTGSEMIVWGGYITSDIYYLNTGGRYNPVTDSWIATSTTNVPSARENHTSVWTGTEMIVWGGDSDSGPLNDGGKYNPATDSWTATSITNAPEARQYHTAVWTGNEMIVWGGYPTTNTGGRYNPVTDTWIATVATNAPENRYGHTSVWTGTEMIVWGGYGAGGFGINTGGKYNPSTNSWVATSITNAPSARMWHNSVWTGTEMIVWGGWGYSMGPNTGGRYNPLIDSWTATSITNAPSVNQCHTSVWTGNEMIVWGGLDDHYSTVNTGGRYNPSTDSWIATSITNAPSARDCHTSVWTGTQMIVWGGRNDFTGYLNTGGRYSIEHLSDGPHTFAVRAYDTAGNVDPTPALYNWSIEGTWSHIGDRVPDARSAHSAVWTGSEMIIWGGYDARAGDAMNTGSRYNPVTDSWTSVSLTNAPDWRSYHSAIWIGSEMIVWGGANGYYLNTGGRYNPSTDAWVSTSITNAPSGRSRHTAVWTGNEMIVWGGYTGSAHVNTGGRYNPFADSWVATSISGSPVGRSEHTAAWTGQEMIVWGGWDYMNDFNTGGKYNPITDSWTATSTVNAPSARQELTAIWDGTEMIIWGGDAYQGASWIDYNTGGRYNPVSDTWIATSTENAPSPRCWYSGVWTGQEMVVWGGWDGHNAVNTGGIYNPTTDSWAATTTVGAPRERERHSTVWTGTEMIVWGGDDGPDYTSQTNTGGRYNPETDSWIPTNADPNHPSGRYDFSSVWTGSEMIVWGGENYDYFAYCSNDGARYNPTTDSWAATSIGLNVPAARAGASSVWTGREMIIWGGLDDSRSELNTGGRYNPSTDSWVSITITNAPTARSSHTAVWTGSEMIIWGGATNTGGRYNPDGNSWSPTSTINAPTARSTHSAVWDGTEMIIWGGYPYTNTGGRYNPNTNSWVPTSTVNCPNYRSGHTAIWTGTEMIVWGGLDNSGGRYNPSSDSWLATSLVNAPSGITGHSAIWTGNEMLIWGGISWDPFYQLVNTGGIYNPTTDFWIEIPILNAPTSRESHAAVWTGSAMIIWGGWDGTNYFGDGGIYIP